MRAPKPSGRVITGLFLSLLAWPLAACTPEGASAADGNARTGKPLYEKHCVGCHGKGGKGIGTLPDLSDAAYMAGRPDAQLLDKIAKGGQGTGMPAWEKILSESQRHDVLAYIRTLAK